MDIVQQPVRARMCGFGDKVSQNTEGGPKFRLSVSTGWTHGSQLGDDPHTDDMIP